MPIAHEVTDLAAEPAPRDHSLGHPHAPLVLVEYGDFECPNCKQAAPVVKQWRHFPLVEVHPNALNAALAAEVAGASATCAPRRRSS